MQKLICACKDELTEHSYLADNSSFEEGYVCLSCNTYKLFDANGEFDALDHYSLMKLKAANEQLRNG